MLERRFPRAVESLDAIFAFVHAFVAERRLDPELAYALDLVAEELFMNQVKHARGGSHEVELALDAGADAVTLVLRDFDVDGFDPRGVSPVDPDTPLDERQPGGLGIHFVQRIADGVRYDYADRTVTLTVTKRLRS